MKTDKAKRKRTSKGKPPSQESQPASASVNQSPLKRKNLLSCGSTLINLACTGRPDGAFVKGMYYLFVGDSNSGKTFLCLTCFAEASIATHFAGYRLIYDNVENGASMDFNKFFGPAVAERVEAPGVDRETKEPTSSKSVEDFYDNVWAAIKKKEPFIYVLDSENALTSEAEMEKAEEQREAREKDKDSSGSYGDGKAKYHSSHLRTLLPHLKETGSILIIISQTRDNLGFGFEKKTRSGGRALKFYASLEMWSSVVEKIKKTVKGKPRTIGIVSEVQIKKNRFTGKDRSVTMDIYHSVGIDDTGSCIDYLVQEKHWESSKQGRISAPEFEFEGTRDALIEHIESKELRKDLSSLVAQVWDEIEAACAVKRVSKYHVQPSA